MRNKNNSFFRHVFILGLIISFTVLFAGSASAGSYEVFIKIIHANDIHSHLNGLTLATASGGTEEVGGMARIAQYIKNMRKSNPNTLALLAGDAFQGTLFYNFFKGEAEIASMNAAGFDVMCPGNHEFDEGAARFLTVAKDAGFDILNSNLDFDASIYGDSGKVIKPYVIKEFSGVKVAVIGSISKNLDNLVNPAHIKGVTVNDPAGALNRIIDEIRNRVDVVIVLSHNGAGVDAEIAGKVPGIDIIVGGHSHTKLDAPIYVDSPDKRKTAIFQAYEKGEYVGEINFAYCLKEKRFRIIDSKLERITAGLDKVPQVQAVIDKYASEISAQVMTVIGETVRPLVGERSAVRNRETNLGDLLSDMLLSHTKADMAVINGGSIRASIAKGEIKTADCINAFPFNQPLVIMKIKGKHIKAAFGYIAQIIAGNVSLIETQVQAPSYSVIDSNGRFYEYQPLTPIRQFSRASYGGFLQVSKDLHVTYGSGVAELSFKGEPIEDEKIYTLATSDFTSNGGDGLIMFNEALEKSSGDNLTGLFTEYIKTQKIIDIDTDGRIKN